MLNEAGHLPWVEDLLGKIEECQDEFNAGKFRGAVFQMNFVAKEQMVGRPMTVRRSSTKNRPSDGIVRSSTNLGRMLAGSAILESLSNNKRLQESVNNELTMRMSQDEEEEDSSEMKGNITTGLGSVSIADYSGNFGQSAVTSTIIGSDPLSYASRLCKLLKNSDDRSENSQEVATLDNLRGMVRQIFLKIRE